MTFLGEKKPFFFTCWWLLNHQFFFRSSNLKNFGGVASAPHIWRGVGGGGSKIPVLKIGRGYLPKQFWYTIFIYLTTLAQSELYYHHEKIA